MRSLGLLLRRHFLRRIGLESELFSILVELDLVVSPVPFLVFLHIRQLIQLHRFVLLLVPEGYLESLRIRNPPFAVGLADDMRLESACFDRVLGLLLFEIIPPVFVLLASL